MVKGILALSGLLALILATPISAHAQASGGCSGVPNITVGTTTYAPQWCQEFNSAVGSPDTTVWNFNLGGGGWGNGEAEIYCGPPGYPGNPSQCPTTFSTATAPVYIDGNGHLVIRPIYENSAWLSSRMLTDGKEAFTYGLLLASIQMPDVYDQGLWPAFWALGSNCDTVAWPTCGESDMVEDWSNSIYSGPGDGAINSTIHTQDTGGTGVSTRYTFPGGQASNTGFHTYGMLWQSNQLQYFVDTPSAPFVTLTPGSLPSGDTWPFNQSMYAILNVAVGGTLGGSSSSLTSPAQPMYVDYVRWYTPVTNSTPVGPAGYTFCAPENGTCSFSGTASVAFGANGSFNYGNFTNGTACNNTVFGDPDPGVVKACFYQTAPTGPAGYTYCAPENGTCSFSGTANVAFGANGSFNYGTFTNSTACNDSVFGDPAYGVVKACFYEPTTSISNGTTYTLAPQNATGLRLDDYGANTAPGSTIDVYSANNSVAQNWILNNTGVSPSGYYNIANAQGAFCVTASGTGSTSLVTLQPCNGSSGQAWEAVQSAGFFIFHPANNTANCLDVRADVTASGTLVQVYACNGGNNEQWALTVN